MLLPTCGMREREGVIEETADVDKYWPWVRWLATELACGTSGAEERRDRKGEQGERLGATGRRGEGCAVCVCLAS